MTISKGVPFVKTKIAIVGSSGFIGSNLALHFSNLENYLVKGSFFSRQQNPASGKVQQFKVDCRELGSMKQFFEGSDVVVMCAAITSGAKDISRNPLVHLSENMIMNTVALQAAYESGVKRFIFLSSNTVYPPGVQAMREGDENDYYYPSYEVVATMKRNTERICELYPKLEDKPMDTRIVRPANSYGPNDKFDPEISHVIPALINKIVASDGKLEVWGDGKDIKDFIYIDDLVQGIQRVIEYEGSQRVFNIVSGRDSTIQEVIEILKVVSGKSTLQVMYDETKPKMIPIRRLSGELASKELGFATKTKLMDGIRKTYEWYLENRSYR